MFFTIALDVLYIVLGIVGFYILATIVFFSLVRIEKDEKGNLILDLDSWHFKFAYPLKKFKIKKAVEALERTRANAKADTDSILRAEDYAKKVCLSFKTGICAYGAKIFWMTYFGWPALIVFLVLKTIVYLPFMVLLGSFPIASLKTMSNVLYYNSDNTIIALAAVGVGKIPLSKIYGYRIFPIYYIFPLVYSALLYFYLQETWNVTFWVLSSALAISCAAAFIIFLFWICDTDRKSVNLFKEWFVSQKQKVCPIMEAKHPSIG